MTSVGPSLPSTARASTSGNDDDAMEGPSTGAGGKRQRDEHVELTGYTRALNVLQRTLPKLRPRAEGSTKMVDATEVLLEQWLISAYHRDQSKFDKKPTLRKDVTKKQRFRVKEAVGDEVWFLVTNATQDEMPELVECAIKLNSRSGRAHLVAQHDASMERQVDDAFEPWTHASDDDELRDFVAALHAVDGAASVRACPLPSRPVAVMYCSSSSLCRLRSVACIP